MTKSTTERLLEQAAKRGSAVAAVELARVQARKDRAKRGPNPTEQRRAENEAKRRATSRSRATHLIDPNHPPMSDHEVMAELYATNHACDVEDGTPGARDAANAEAVKLVASLGGSATPAELCAAGGVPGWTTEDACIVRLNRVQLDGLATVAYVNFPASYERRFTINGRPQHAI